MMMIVMMMMMTTTMIMVVMWIMMMMLMKRNRRRTRKISRRAIVNNSVYSLRHKMSQARKRTYRRCDDNGVERHYFKLSQYILTAPGTVSNNTQTHTLPHVGTAQYEKHEQW